MARTTPLRKFAILAVLLEAFAKQNSIILVVALRVRNASGLRALADLLSRPTHPPRIQMEEAEEEEDAYPQVSHAVVILLCAAMDVLVGGSRIVCASK